MLRTFTFPVKLRLLDTWAPEKYTESGKLSARRLSELLPVDVSVKVFIDTADAQTPFDVITFDRVLAYLWVIGHESEPPINLQMVREGYATETKRG
jgi:endonuclease YncB( thermonuclease family)